MIFNKYDVATKEFTESIEIKSELIKGMAFATTIKPKVQKDGFTQTFNETSSKWEYVEDNREKIVYSKTTKETIEVDYLGKIKDEHTLLVPKEFDVWSEEAQDWIEDEKAKKTQLEALKRNQRDILLQEFDIKVQVYNEQVKIGLKDENSQEYIQMLKYKQYLRDIPQDENFPDIEILSFLEFVKFAKTIEDKENLI